MMKATVIIPTHNRREWIGSTIATLTAQTGVPEAPELIVVTDRCTDGTGDMLRSRFGERVRVIESSGAGQPAALNTGIAAATGNLAIFLDDEMRAAPGFIAAHMNAHQAAAGSLVAVTGYSPVLLTRNSPPLHVYLAERYEKFHRALASGELSRAPSGFSGMNVSIPVEEVRNAGGFNTSYFFQRNDFELGARLIAGGYSIVYAADARADQELALTAESMVDRAEPRGQNDARLAREFPWSIPWLPFAAQLRSDSAMRRWRAVWLARGAIGSALGRLRAVRKDNLPLLRYEYAARYAVSLIRSLGGWKEFAALAPAARDK
jgi:glycosyltransferase involved in cell wall biosynthesis